MKKNNTFDFFMNNFPSNPTEEKIQIALCEAMIDNYKRVFKGNMKLVKKTIGMQYYLYLLSIARSEKGVQEAAQRTAPVLSDWYENFLGKEICDKIYIKVAEKL